MPPKRCGKGPDTGGGSTPATGRARGKAVTAGGTATSGETRRRNLSNPPPGMEEPSTSTATSTAAEPSRVAGDKNHSRARGNNSASSSPTRGSTSSLPVTRSSASSSSPRPRNPCPGTGRPVRSTCFSCSYFASLSINDAGSRSGSSLPAAPGSTTSAHGSDESTTRHRAMDKTATAGLISVPQRLRLTVKAGTNSSIDETPRHRATHTKAPGSNGETTQKNRAAVTQKDCGKKRAVRSKGLSAEQERQMMKNVQDEAERAIRRLNELGLGEDISYEEVQAYAARLPCSPPRVVIDVKPDYDQLNQLQIQNILYRIKFLKVTRQMRKNGEGGYGYGNWTLYRGYFHSYEVELEYLRYWKELLKNLKWMEDYVLMKRPSLTWGKICTRGCYQAIKIASCFSKITEGVARMAYHECIETMRLDICWYKELDGVYFEIWKRIDKLKMTFRDALDCVYKLNTFPRYHLKMKAALDNDDWSNMEKEFRICTSYITTEMAEDIAREFIADAIKSRRQRPKFYVHYIKKKIKIAGILGVIPKALQSTEKQLFEALVQ